MKMEAFYITNLGLLDNLAQTQILPYLEGLSRKGIKIHILSFEKKENLENKFYVESVEKRLRDLYIQWHSSLYHKRWGNAWDMFVGLIKTFKIVKNRDISILHARATVPMLIAWPVAKMLRRKIIYDRRGTMVGDFVDDVNVKNIFSIKIFSIILEAIDRFIMRYSNAIIILSKKALMMLKEDRYISSGDKIIESIPCCTDISKFRNNKAEGNLKIDLSGRFVMNYVGSLGTCYLLKEMAEFFKILKGKKENALFLIISHTDKRFIDDILKKERLLSQVDYIVISVSPEEVAKYLAKCSFSIMFIKPVECKIGSSPTKFAESLAAGIPVCINRGIGDTDKVITDEQIGVIVDSFDEISYQRAIKKLDNLFLDKSLSFRCRQVASKYFSLEMGVTKYATIYNRLCKGSHEYKKKA